MSWAALSIGLPLLLGLACSQGEVPLPGRLSGCEDTECRAAWVVDHWSKDAAGTTSAVLAEQDPIARLSLVLTLTEAFPGEVGALCASLPEGGDGRTRCMKLNSRPHLQAAAKDEKAIETGRWKRTFGPCPVTPLPQLDMGLEPLPVDCPPGETVASCHGSASMTAAEQGLPVDAVRHCLAVPDPLWADECIFIAAESMAWSGLGRQWEAERFAHASRMCTLATRFIPDCLNHLQQQLEKAAPRAEVGQRPAWGRRARVVKGVAEGAGQLPADLVSWYTAQLWSGMVASAVDATPGASLAFLPVLAPDYRAFLWDALIWKTMRVAVRQGVRKQSLSGWVALVGRLPNPQMSTATTPHVGSDGASVPYLGSTWRPYHPLQAVDLQISVLMAARGLLSGPEFRALYREAQSADDALLANAAILISKRPRVAPRKR